MLVKIFKLLLNELHHLKGEDLLDDYDTDDEEEDFDPAGNPMGSPNGPSKFLRSSDLWFDDGEDEDNQMLQELLPDPAFANNIVDNLTKFLQNFAHTEQFAEYAQTLSESEKLILRSIQVNV